MSTRLLPNGFCWCGCGREVGLGKFFASGHDKRAEAAVMAVHYEASVARLLADHGYGPDKSVTAAAVEAGAWEECPRDDCDYRGASIRDHLNRHHAPQDIANATQAVKDFTDTFTKPIPRKTSTTEE